jgi:hypothetical protein
MTFDFQWTAPNGLPVVVQTVTFPDGNAQLVGVLMQESPPSIGVAGSGWSVISAPVYGESGDLILNADETAQYAKKTLAGVAAGNNVMFYYAGPGSTPFPNGVKINTSTGNPRTVNGSIGPGWFARSISGSHATNSTAASATGQAQQQAQQWGLQQLAQQSQTVSSVSPMGQPGAPPPQAAPVAAAAGMGAGTMLLLGGAALGAYFFFFKK